MVGQIDAAGVEVSEEGFEVMEEHEMFWRVMWAVQQPAG